MDNEEEHIGKVIKVSKNDDLNLLEPNYEGISKMLDSFANLYTVCEDKKLIEKLIEKLTMPPVLFKN